MKSWAFAERGRGDDLGLGGVGTTVAEVLADGAVEEVVILPDVADATAELGEPKIADVEPIDIDGS
jgi:saccharopine dehydrogenase-like NADP-dependent oxidoreductase